MKKTSLPLLFLATALLISCGGGSGNRIESNPENSFSHYYYLGMAAFEKGDYNEAIKQFKKSISLKSDVARTHNELGACYLQLGRYREAIPHFEQALSIDPRMDEAHNSLGVCHMFLGNYRDAELHFQAVLASKNYGTPFLPLYNLGNLYFRQNDFEQALGFYRQALEEEEKVTPEYRIYIHLQMGNIYFEQERFADALKEFDEVLVLNPRLLEAAYKGGVSAHRTGKDEIARSFFAKVLASGSNSEWAKKTEEYLKNLES